MFKTVTSVSVLAALAACQTTGGQPVMSTGEARAVGLAIQQSGYPVPRRTIADIIEKYQWVPASTCSITAVSPAEALKYARQGYDFAPPLTDWYGPSRPWLARDFARIAYLRGNIDNAVTFMDWADDAVSNRAADVSPGWTGWNSVFAHRRAIFLAHAGQLDAAGAAKDDGDALQEYNWTTSFFTEYTDHFRSWAAAAIAKMRGNLEQAESEYRVAINLNRRAYEGVPIRLSSYLSRLNTLELMLRVELAETLAKQGRLMEAEGVVRHALNSIRTRPQDWLARVWALQKLADIIYRQGRYEDARELAELAVRFYNGTCAGWGLGAALARSIQARSSLALGETGRASAVYDDLKTSLAGNESLLDTRFADDLHWAATDLKSDKLGSAEQRIRKALTQTRARIGKGSTREAVAQGLLGVLFFKQGKLEEAKTTLSQSIKVLVGGDTRDGLNPGVVWPFLTRFIVEGYLDLLIDLGTYADLATAFEVGQGLESGRVQKALHQSAARAASITPALSALVRREQDLSQQITALQEIQLAGAMAPGNTAKATFDDIQKALPALAASHKALQREIAEKFPSYDALINPKPLTVTQVQASLRSGDALLVVRTVRDRTLVWVVPKNGDMTFASIKLGHAELAELVGRVRRTLDPVGITRVGDILPFDLRAANRIYQAVLRPVADGFRNARQLIAVIQGPLDQLPLSLLPTEAMDPGKDDGLLFTKYRKIPWLARRHAVTVLPGVTSLRVLAERVGPRAGRRAFLGIGDPIFSARDKKVAATTRGVVEHGRQVRFRSVPQTRAVDSADLAKLPRLPDTGPELISIAMSLGSDPKDSVILGERATEGFVKSADLSKIRVLAFATHGLLPGDLDGLNQPALALTSPTISKEKGTDGLLTMGEILGLKLATDWVILSACNTGAGEGAGAEAVSGLGRAFFYAGTRALLVSNWPVFSASTVDLTTTLFKVQAERSSITRTEALRQARLNLIDEKTFETTDGKAVFSYAHPIFWAPFTIVGDGGGLQLGS
ncbi:MAG: CHAT domain-containing protein [Proteobacteria bacterium]|nr:CHAT domain-containing protein [Pseudomonadota bacterium]